MSNYLNVMIDLETLGKKPGSKILSIGACTFGSSEINSRKQFYRTIQREQPGLVEDIDTVEWWAKQDIKAQQELFNSPTSIPIGIALTEFALWLRKVEEDNPGKILRVWGNAASFDLKILEYAYVIVTWNGAPWGFRNEMCFRTLKNLFPKFNNMPFTGTKHNALDDAIHQAEIAEYIFDSLYNDERIFPAAE